LQPLTRPLKQALTEPLTLTQRIAEIGPSLSPISRRIADHLAQAGPEVVLLSAADLAAELGTSDASIIRTAKALGYAGLDDLRRAITASATEPSLEERLRRSLADGEGGGSILHSLISQHVAGLDGLARRVDPDLFERAVAMLAESERILWSGTGPSAAVAEYGVTLATRLGFPSSIVRGSGTQLADELLALRRGDALVLLAYGRMTGRARAVLDRCEEVELPVVLITDAAPRQLSERVDVVLACGRGTPGLFSSHATTVILIEAIVLALAASDPARAEESLALLNDLRASVAGRRRDVYLA
jgi:DNA-binding MurR/RpiR family transcriptional regulator